MTIIGGNQGGTEGDLGIIPGIGDPDTRKISSVFSGFPQQKATGRVSDNVMNLLREIQAKRNKMN